MLSGFGQRLVWRKVIDPGFVDEDSGFDIDGSGFASKVVLPLRIGSAARCKDVAMPFRKLRPFCLGYAPSVPGTITFEL